MACAAVVPFLRDLFPFLGACGATEVVPFPVVPSAKFPVKGVTRYKSGLSL